MNWYGGTVETTGWEFPKGKQNEFHVTQKPIEVVEKALKKSSKKNDYIYDCFLGGGSTMVASHQLNRKCYGMELDPKYVDVIVKRWQDFTGQQALHMETGRKFDELKDGTTIQNEQQKDSGNGS